MSSEAPEGGGGETKETQEDGATHLTLEDIEACSIIEMAKDKFKSRQLQRSLVRGGQEHIDIIFRKVVPHIMELVSDQHGNYLLQKVMEVVSTDQFDSVFDLLKSSLITLAKDTHGTRAVQKIVEQAIARDRVDQLLQVLPTDQAEELARNITGFHVIVKLLDSLPADKALGFLDRLCGSAEKVQALGKDQWGCCVLKKCVDRSEGAMKEKIVDSIAAGALELVQDAFGNYVVQHLLLNNKVVGPNPNVGRVIDGLKGHVFELSLQKYSSNVLEKCLGSALDKDRNKIINEILNPPEQKPSQAICLLLFHQFGNYVFQQALEVAKDPQFSLLIEHSRLHVQALYIEACDQQSKGGKATASDAPTTYGNLPAEHTQRLAVKLMKKYPSLMEGMDMGSMMPEMDAAWMFDYDPMGYGAGLGYYGMDAFGYPLPGYEAYGGYGNFAFPMAFQAPKGGKGSGRGRARTQKADQGNRKGKQGGVQRGTDSTAQVDAAGETTRVGRIVGFWPNYEITYDEVPTGSQAAGGNRGGRSKNNKAKGKSESKQAAVDIAPPPGMA